MFKYQIINLMVLSVTLMNCASSHFNSVVDKHGIVNDSKAGTDYVITPNIIFGTSPEGIFFDNNNREIKWDSNTYDFIGTIRAIKDDGIGGTNLGFKNFNEEWRKYYCPVNITITFATLFIWMATPFPYFCLYEKSCSEKRMVERKNTIFEKMKKRGQEIGATDIFIPEFSEIETNKTTGAAIPIGDIYLASSYSEKSTFPYSAAIGYAFKRKK